jgi:hypothetical protein
MRNESVTTPRDNPPSHLPHEPRNKQEPARGREDVQRFRKLMDRTTPDGDQDEAASETSAAAGQLRKPLQDQEQVLRDLLARQLAAAREQGLGLPPRGDEDDGGQQQDGQGEGADGQAMNAGAQALHQARQTVLHAADQPAPAAQAALAPALAELIERHVKQLLVPDNSVHSASQSREIMITLKDGVLPGAELWLSRTDTGWKLRADTRLPETYRQLLDGAPQLIERFAQQRLGELEIDPVLLS